MQRILEPELMESAEQSEAYAAADFSESNSQFVEMFLANCPTHPSAGRLLDLGCGDGDILFRLASRLPGWEITGVDGSEAMLAQALNRLEQSSTAPARLQFVRGLIPTLPLRKHAFDIITSNSLLHHLHRPEALWETILTYGKPGTFVFIKDLFRPASPELARVIVRQYAASAPAVLQRDFYNSLLAAFRVPELRRQLDDCGLPHFQVHTITDRHLAIIGRI